MRGDHSHIDAQAVLIEAREIVANDMTIDYVETPKDPKLGVVAIRGRLLDKSEIIFPRWLEAFKRRGYTPVLQPDTESTVPGNVVLRIMPGVVRPTTESKHVTNLVLFVVTVISTLNTGAFYSQKVELPASLTPERVTSTLEALGLLLMSNVYLLTSLECLKGWPFALTVMGILTAHEFGHYFAARFHKVTVTLPFFIPLPPPIGLFGTMGAFIKLKEPISDRRKLFDIGVAGPLAGIVLAIPLLFVGLSTSDTTIIQPNSGGFIEGNSILYYLAKFAIFGQGLPNWTTGEDVLMNQVTFGAWIGLLVTALNLLPVGQLDGGHTVFALLGNRARYVNIAVLVMMAVLGCLGLPFVQERIPGLENIGFVGWFVWLGLIYMIIGPYHPPALDDVTELDQRRRWVGYLVIIIFILTFTPVPLRPL